MLSRAVMCVVAIISQLSKPCRTLDVRIRSIKSHARSSRPASIHIQDPSQPA